LKTPRKAVAKGGERDERWIQVAPADLPTVLADLKQQGFASWCFLTCVDHLNTPLLQPPPERFELVYQLRNITSRELIRVRAYIAESEPSAPSVHSVYAPAAWDEREVFDLFGITFSSHPDLRRILLPPDWVGHPLRRDYPVGGEPVEFSDDHQSWQTAPAEA